MVSVGIDSPERLWGRSTDRPQMLGLGPDSGQTGKFHGVEQGQRGVPLYARAGSILRLQATHRSTCNPPGEVRPVKAPSLSWKA